MAVASDLEVVRAEGPAHDRWPALGYGAAVALMIAAMIVPRLLHIDVHETNVPPLASTWQPRFGPGTIPSIALGLSAVIWGPHLAQRLSWSRLLIFAFVAGVAWLVALATVDGWSGIGRVLDYPGEYLGTARQVSGVSVSTLLHEFIDRIPAHSTGHWTVHVAGHPPGVLLFFVLLVHLGLGGGLAAGWVVVVTVATTPVAVLITLRRLDVESAARRAAPLLVIGPAAVWMAVSADALFGAIAAWGCCALAIAATTRARAQLAAWSLLAGVLLGYCVFLSYGLVLLALLALTVLLAAGNARPLPGAIVGALAVVAVFAAFGFAWWHAYPVLRTRYWAGIASLRPTGYWIWADIAALCFSAGPLLGASLVAAARGRLRTPDRPVVLLALSSALCILLADLSLMSKAEVERIWLPFVPWLLLGSALLPARWRQRALAVQVALALVVQSLLNTHW